MLPAVQHLHLLGGPPHRAGVAAVCIPVLPQGGAVWAQRPQAEGAEAGSAGQAGVRGHLHDGGQGLGGRADLGADDHGEDTGKAGERGAVTPTALWCGESTATTGAPAGGDFGWGF